MPFIATTTDTMPARVDTKQQRGRKKKKPLPQKTTCHPQMLAHALSLARARPRARSPLYVALVHSLCLCLFICLCLCLFISLSLSLSLYLSLSLQHAHSSYAKYTTPHCTTCALTKHTCIRQHTSEYVSIRQHTLHNMRTHKAYICNAHTKHKCAQCKHKA